MVVVMVVTVVRPPCWFPSNLEKQSGGVPLSGLSTGGRWRRWCVWVGCSVTRAPDGVSPPLLRCFLRRGHIDRGRYQTKTALRTTLTALDKRFFIMEASRNTRPLGGVR
ncbi:hypothetical protein GN956_G11646 [Arapaima gigas]